MIYLVFFNSHKNRLSAIPKLLDHSEWRVVKIYSLIRRNPS